MNQMLLRVQNCLQTRQYIIIVQVVRFIFFWWWLWNFLIARRHLINRRRAGGGCLGHLIWAVEHGGCLMHACIHVISWSAAIRLLREQALQENKGCLELLVAWNNWAFVVNYLFDFLH